MYDYELLFVTNLPSFYKINLFNEIAKKIKIKVIFVSNTSVIRNSDFSSSDIAFEYQFLSNVDYESRIKFGVFFTFLKTIINTSFRRLIFSGWETKELIPLMLLLPKEKCGIVIESSIIESKTEGVEWYLKRLILRNMSCAFPSGLLQKAILDKAKYTGKVFLTNGVGIMNYTDRKRHCELKKTKDQLRFLYVGRMSEEKNVHFLVNEFNKSKKPLSFAGSGPQLKALEESALINMNFLGYINNSHLDKIYGAHDVLVLPSYSEAWGLVVDEALWHGLPVIVSDKVGCSDDLVLKTNAGIVFEVDNSEAFNKAIIEMETNYLFYKRNAMRIDFETRNNQQVQVYCNC